VADNGGKWNENLMDTFFSSSIYHLVAAQQGRRGISSAPEMQLGDPQLIGMQNGQYAV
jgi:hypothetical protein